MKIKKVLIKLFILLALAIGVLALFVVFIDVPDLKNPEARRVVESTKIYDRTGQILLYDIHGEEKRTIIPFEEIPRYIKNATIALEDDSFYRHYGVRPLSFFRAVMVNLLHGDFEQGGSTITQQVVKNTLLTNEKTVLRKLKEWVVAIKIERRYSKDEILNLYLNQIPYGGNAYGIQAAAQTFFNKNAQDITPLEAAYLVSLPKAPSYFSPYGKHRKELDNRALFTLNKMKKMGFLSKVEYEEAKKQTVKFSLARTQGIIAPHFVSEIREELNQRFGEDVVERGGFKVTTTLDVDLQQKAEEIITKYSPINEKSFNAKNTGMIVVDPKTGGVLAMVGSRDYFDTEHEGNFNITTAHRQPGSAFKPFVYATAFKKGFTPETVVFDLPTEFNPLCTPDGKPTGGVDEKKCYHPQNFDGKFRGPISLKEALAQSLNIPSVKVLYLASVNDSLGTARDFGITSLNDPARYGLTLVLGGGEVSLLELTSAYGVFANGGVRNNSFDISKIDDASGKTLYENKIEPHEVIDQNIASAINDILSDNKARGPSFGEALYFPGKKVAAKTGTTNNYKDAWVVGYTPDIVVGSWAGNNNNTPMEKKVAGFIVAPMWHEFMEYALTKFPNSQFTQYEQNNNTDKPFLWGEWRGGKEYIIDKSSGKLATEYTPKDMREKKVVQEVHSILYWIDQSSSQFRNWEDSVRKWAFSNGYTDQDENTIPKDYDDTHTPENLPKILEVEILPKKTSYSPKESVTLRPKITSKFNIIQVDYFTTDEEIFIGSVKKQPFDMMVNLEKNNSFVLKIYDSAGNTSQEKIYIPLIGMTI